MKQITCVCISGLFLLLIGSIASAQEAQTAVQQENTSERGGWNQGRKGIYSFGIGGTQVIALDNGFSYITRPGLSFNFSGEYRIHRFVGLGFQTGMNMWFYPAIIRYYPDYYVVVRSARVAIGIPIAIKTNIHILEAANVAIADRLDVYAGLHLGGGPAFYTGPGDNIFGFIQVGPQAGVRYWANRRIAVFGEVGWGATFANVGLTF